MGHIERRPGKNNGVFILNNKFSSVKNEDLSPKFLHACFRKPLKTS